MRRQWAEVSLPQVIDFQEGPGILAKDFRSAGVPLIRLAGLDRGAHPLDGCNYLDPETVARRWAHFRVRIGDTLLSTSASLGRTAIVDARSAGAIPYTGIIRMRARDERLDGAFIRFLLEAPSFQAQAEMLGVGSVIRHFGPSHLRAMRIILPPVEQQRTIAELLGTLDDKIELNRRTSETLDQTVRTLFSATCSNQAAEWPNARVGDAGRIMRVSVDPQREPKREFVHFSIPAFDADREPTRDRGEAIRSNKFSVPPGSVLLSKLNPSIERVWLPALSAGSVGICSTEFLVFLPQAWATRAYLYGLFTSAQFRTALAAGVTGTSNSHQRARAEDVLKISVLHPPADVIERFDTVAATLLDRIQHAQDESTTLAALRDALLPRLLSGSLRVRDAEREVELAV